MINMKSLEEKRKPRIEQKYLKVIQIIIFVIKIIFLWMKEWIKKYVQILDFDWFILKSLTQKVFLKIRVFVIRAGLGLKLMGWGEVELIVDLIRNSSSFWHYDSHGNTQHDTNNKQFFNKLGFMFSTKPRMSVVYSRTSVLCSRTSVVLLEPTLGACHNLGPMLLRFMFRHSYMSWIYHMKSDISCLLL